MDETRQVSPPFERVGRREYGYNTRQVDDFLAKAQSRGTAEEPAEPLTSRSVRSMAFDPAKAGYEPQAVDAALDRLEDGLARREKNHVIEDMGEEAWLVQIGRASAVLRGRLHRGPGERFRRPGKSRVPSYNIEDVDALCHELIGYFEQDQPLSVDEIRRAVFRETRGADGYEETQVDAFLDRVVELMAAID